MSNIFYIFYLTGSTQEKTLMQCNLNGILFYRRIKKAFDWLQGLPNMDIRTRINSPRKNTYRYYVPEENNKSENKENSNSKRSKKKNHSRSEIFHFNKI